MSLVRTYDGTFIPLAKIERIEQRSNRSFNGFTHERLLAVTSDGEYHEMYESGLAYLSTVVPLPDSASIIIFRALVPTVVKEGERFKELRPESINADDITLTRVCKATHLVHGPAFEQQWYIGPNFTIDDLLASQSLQSFNLIADGDQFTIIDRGLHSCDADELRPTLLQLFMERHEDREHERERAREWREQQEETKRIVEGMA